MKYRILFICVMISVAAAAQTKPSTTKPKTPAKPATSNTPALKTALDSFSYAMGMSMANFCDRQGIPKVNNSLVLQGLNSSSSKQSKPLLTEQQMNQIISSYLNKVNAEKANVAKAAGKKFLEENAKKPGVVTLASGLQYVVIKAGTDTTHPRVTDTVVCHYHGTLLNGRVFDSSVERGEPAEFRPDEVIRGWTEALQLMTVGSKWRLFVPSELAYGDRQAGPDIEPGSTLIFDLEILGVKKGG